MCTSRLWFCKLNFQNFRRKIDDSICHCSLFLVQSLVPFSFWKLKRLHCSSHSNQRRAPLPGVAEEVVSAQQSSAFSSASSPVVLPCLKGGGWEVLCRIAARFILHVGGTWDGQTPARPCLLLLWLQLRHNVCSHLQERFKTRTSAGGQLHSVEASAMPHLSRLHDRAGMHRVYWMPQY